MRKLLLQLFQVVLETRTSREFEGYEPVALNSPARYATYSANLVILTLLVAGKMKASELFTASDDVVNEWRRLALLWRSQLSAEGWQWLSESVRIVRVQVDGGRDLVLSAAFLPVEPSDMHNPGQVSDNDLYWVFDMSPTGEVSRWSTADSPGGLVQRYRFTCSLEDEIIVHALKPLFDHLGFSATTFCRCSDSRSVSCANAFLRLWILSATRTPSGELAEAYDDCINFCLPGATSIDEASVRMLREIVVRQLRGDMKRLSGLWRSSTRERLINSADYVTEAGSWIDSVVASLGLR